MKQVLMVFRSNFDLMWRTTHWETFYADFVKFLLYFHNKLTFSCIFFRTCEIISPKLKATSLQRWWLHWFERIHQVGFSLGRSVFFIFWHHYGDLCGSYPFISRCPNNFFIGKELLKTWIVLRNILQQFLWLSCIFWMSVMYFRTILQVFSYIFSDFWGLTYLELKNMYFIALLISSRYQ